MEEDADSSGCFCTGADLVEDVPADLAGEGLSGEDPAGDDLAGESLSGEDPAGDGLAGEGLVEEGLSGEDSAGDVLAGEGLSGEDPAGDDLAGEGLSGEDPTGEDLSRECPAIGISSSDSRSLGPSDTPLELNSDSSTLILFLRTHFLAMT